MRKKLQLIGILSFLAFSFQGYSQTRYLEEFFSSVTVTSDVVYGINLSVLTGVPAADTLKCDVYEPTGDTETDRPLVFVYHTGSFLPAIANGSALGDKTDSAIVEMCMRFAKKGYVAVAPNYRLGWNPTSAEQEVRTGTIINAVYRATQDARNCIRFFRMDDATADTYKIDESKIACGGLGSGGYMALSIASLQRETETDSLSKFFDFRVTPPVKFVDTAMSGNLLGTLDRPLNIANYPTYSSDVSMAFNCGGSVGDSSFIEAGEVPIVGFHCYKDENSPYTTGNIYVTSTGDFVIEGTGNHSILRIVNQPAINNNQLFIDANISDVYTTRANQVNDGYEGFFSFVTSVPGAAMNCTGLASDPQKEQYSPWDWWNEAYLVAAYGAYSGTGDAGGGAANCKQLVSNPDMSAEKGRLYIDTIQGYLAPRMACALGLPGSGCTGYVAPTVGIEESASASTVVLFPNPASTAINIAASSTIEAVELVDLTGRVVSSTAGLSTQAYTIQTEGVTAGLYIVRITLSNGTVSKKVIIE